MTDLGAAIEQFLLELRVERGLAPLTISAYRRDLGQFAHVAGDLWQANPEPARDWLSEQRRDGRRATTLARKVAALRSFYGFALREGIVERDIASLLDSPKPGSYLPDVLSVDEVVRILDAPPADDPVGIRDRAILELLYDCGLRVSELVGIDRHRLDLPGLQVRVIGKGNKERRVPMGEEARERLHRYLVGPHAAWTAKRPTEAVFVGERGSAPEPRSGVAPGAALDRGGRGHEPRVAAHIPAHLCDASARGRSRSARRSDPVGPC